MADAKKPSSTEADTQNLRRRLGDPMGVERGPTDDDLRPLGQGGQLDPEAVARRWERWSKYLVPAILATAVSLATGIPTVISVFRDRMHSLEHKATTAQEKGDKVELEQKAVYVKVTKPEIEALQKQIAELRAEMVRQEAARRAGQRRRPIPVAPVPKIAPLPPSPAAVLQAPAPAVAPPRPADAGQ